MNNKTALNMKRVKQRKSKIIFKIYLTCFSLTLFGFSGCSIQTMAVRATGGIIDNTLESLYEEHDVKLAESAMGPHLKMLEGLIKSDPKNKKLLKTVVEGYTGYTLGFVEDEDKNRARLLYKRAFDYGIRLLSLNSKLKDVFTVHLNDIEGVLSSAKMDDVPALFWTANAWASYINLSRSDPGVFMEMPRAIALMNRVLELDEEYYFGGPHLFFGIIYASLGLAGGDIEKSKTHFDRAVEISEGKFLLTKVMYAKYYAVSELDDVLFTEVLNEVQKTPGDILPEYRLINEIAKIKAALYLSQIDEIF